MKKRYDAMLARLVWLSNTLRTNDRSRNNLPYWSLMSETLKHLALKLGGPMTNEMLSGLVTNERRAARRRLLAYKLVHPKMTSPCQYVVQHRGLYKALKKGGFETVRDVVSVDPGEFYRLGNFGSKCKSELILLLQDLLTKDIRLDTLVGRYHFGLEPNNVPRETVAPIKAHIHSLKEQIYEEEKHLDALYGDGYFDSHPEKTKALRRYPRRERN